MDREREYAAVLIPTLCRYEHFNRCVESLKKNSLALYTDLYIGLDYPSKPSHQSGYELIKKMLDVGITGFANVYIFAQDHNIGGTNNLEYIRKEACKKHSRFLYAEDDNEFAADYLEYMNGMLDRYEADESVFAISGYNYPIPVTDAKGTVYTNNIYCASFGAGFWADKYDRMDVYMTVDRADIIYHDRRIMKKLSQEAPNQFCNYVRGCLGYGTTIYHGDGIWKIDLNLGMYMYATGKKMIYPVVSKVRNWGFDGSGENCTEIAYDPEAKVTHRNISVNDQYLDPQTSAEEAVMVNSEDNTALNRLVGEYFEISGKELLRAKAAYYLSLLFGTGFVSGLLGRN